MPRAVEPPGCPTPGACSCLPAGDEAIVRADLIPALQELIAELDARAASGIYSREILVLTNKVKQLMPERRR